MRIIKTLLSKDSSILIIFVVLGIAGLLLFQWKEQSVFPNASINFTINKSEILHLAENWAKRFGYQKLPLIKSIAFNDYDESKTFLEYELGNSQANVLMQNTIPIFYWYCSFRKAFDQETMDITISPTGKLLYFEYKQANDKKIPSINHKDAETKAFAFVKEITGWTKDDCKLVDDDITARLSRTDYDFIWEYQKLEWHGARLRVNIEIAGNLLTGYNYYLKTPEKWQRDYATIRTKNELLASIASVFFYLLYPVSAFIFLRGFSMGTIRWRFALKAGCVMTLISLIESFNSFPVLLSTYTPDSSLQSFIVKSIISPILEAPFLVTLIATVAGAGELVYRNLFPNKIALEKIFTLKGLRSREVLIGLIIGLACFALSLGYQICYYWIGQKFHFWCPLAVYNYQVLSTYCPWFSAINFGAFAASNEEMLYRVLMLGLAKSLFRRFWLANLLQAVAWGFIHSNYPQQPCYARGLELTIEGLFDGWILSRFGLLSCVISHYCFDAFCCVTPLFTGPTYLKLSAILPFLPIIVAIAYSVCSRYKNKSADESMLNRSVICHVAIPAQAKMVSSDSEDIYKPISPKVRWMLMCFIAIGLIIYLITGEKSHTIGIIRKPLHITREQSIKHAQKYLESQNINVSDYKISTDLGNYLDFPNSREQIQYVFEQIGFEKTKKLVGEIEPSFLWWVRFVKPMTPSEYGCWIDEDGNTRSIDIKRGEEESGANLNKHDAQVIAINFLKAHHQKYIPFELKDISETKRKNRTDYHLTFMVPKYKVGDAEFKIVLDVIGDIPCNGGHFWELPDSWTWERTTLTKRQEIFSMVHTATWKVIFAALVLWILLLYKSNKIRWRWALCLSGLLCIGTIVNWLNTLTGFFSSYETTVPLNTFIITSATNYLLILLIIWAIAVSSIAITLAGNSEVLKLKVKTTLSAILSIPQKIQLSKAYWYLWLDAIILAGTLEITIYLLGIILNTIAVLKHEVEIAIPASSLPDIANMFIGSVANTIGLTLNVYMPVGSNAYIINSYNGPLRIGMSLAESLVIIPLLTGLAIAICRQLRLTNYWRFFACILLIYILSNLSNHYWQDFLVGIIACVLYSTLAWYSVRYVFNQNILSLFVLAWISGAYGLVSELWMFGWPTFSKELIISCVFLTYPFIYLLYLHTRITKTNLPP